jgi:GalNAc-alpha-(1->4)-GalNAc-alpha-(1->3)-diNAcBac-PP-undecaprenol alpha-1,4-N-acetyl-D-galactosaminyltransferase
MKITLISSSLKVGGAERVMSIIANYWAARDWQITILSFDDGSAPPFYDLDKRIEYRSLGLRYHSGFNLLTLSHNLRQIRSLKKAIVASRPDLIVSFVNTTNIMTLLASWSLRVPTIVCEHVYPAFGGLGKISQFLQKRLYCRAALVTVQTHSGLSFFPADRGYKTVVIPNPIALPDVEQSDQSQLFTDDRHLLAIGKLIPQKGFDLAIRAFAQVCDTHPEWTLTICGEGEMRGELEDLCVQLRLEDRVYLPGVVKNIDAHLRKADIFVLSSRFEGFPVTLCEAMACGVPVIATDCLSGPREIVHSGQDGVLVVTDNVDALAVGLDLLMSDPVKRQYFSHHAPKVLNRFGVEPVMAIWDGAIRQVLDGQAGR